MSCDYQVALETPGKYVSCDYQVVLALETPGNTYHVTIRLSWKHLEIRVM